MLFRSVGRQCITHYGADPLILTQNGLFPLSAILQATDVEGAKFALSFKIQNAFTEAARSYRSIYGWKTTFFPARDALLVNVPHAEDGTHEQYVMNTITKSWCTFTDWHAEDFAVFNDELYFTRGTAVYKAWTGASDVGSNITFYGKQAFSNFGDQNQKQVKMFMPILSVNGNIAYGADVDVDFEDDDITGTVSYSVVAGAQWDVANWDQAYWAQGQEVVKQWSSPSDWTGRWIAGKIKIQSNALTVQWMGSTMIWEQAPSL